jgi:hypothetical protein
MAKKTTKKYSLNDGYTVEGLLQSGFDHLDAAYELFDSSYRFLDSAGYLAHLGIEIILKGYILHMFGEFDKEHSLAKLCAKICEKDHIFLSDSSSKEFIPKFDLFFELRYPHPERSDGRVEVGGDMVPDIKSLENSIWNALPEQLCACYEKIDHTKKNGGRLMRIQKNI